MKNSNRLFWGLILVLLIQACFTNNGKTYRVPLVDSAAISFINHGIEGSLIEIKASGLVITNSNNQKVIGLAKMMIDDQTMFGDELRKIAYRKEVDEGDTINADHQYRINELSAKSGKAFDRAYLQMMIADHEQATRLYSVATRNADPDVKSFAVKTLATIQMHLDSVNAVLASLK